ncbi:MAG: hypothetical protein NC078_10265 [Ruminococcus sp.]|nr:hypothetical protein [Ruminococcus sp.]
MNVREIKNILQCARRAEREYILARDRANAFGQLCRYKGASSVNDAGKLTVKENSVEKRLCVLADYEAEADELFRELVRQRKNVRKIIGSLTDSIQREVLIRRYILGEKWEEIAVIMNYSIRRVYQLHGEALKNLKKDCSKFH